MPLDWPVAASQLNFNEPIPFQIEVNEERLRHTKQKLELTRYPEEQTDFADDDWSQGAKVSKVKELADYWYNSYDWAEQVRRLNENFEHYLVKLDVPGYGPLVIHYTYTKSSNAVAVPLLFVHGWPGSFVEAERIVSPLTQPENPKDISFDVVAPSIPGFGFSPAPAKSGVGPVIVARAFKQLMVDVLGYSLFATQGGDFGAFITRSIAIQFQHVVRCQHLNMFPAPAPTLTASPRAYLRWWLSGYFYSPFEQESVRRRSTFQADQSGYLEEQRTRPQTLGFALGDSPVGLLAWFIEKFHEWGDLTEVFTNDTIITLVMMHWIQGATPGLRFYREAFDADRREADETFKSYVGCPTGVSMHSKEQLRCPKDWAQQVANIQFWRENAVGGHFPSLERPEELVNDLREFCSALAERGI